MINIKDGKSPFVIAAVINVTNNTFFLQYNLNLI